MPLVGLLPCFQSLSPFPTSKLCPFRCSAGADSRVGGLVYVLGPHGPLQHTLLWNWQFLPLQPPQVFTVRGSEGLSSHAGTLSCTVSRSPAVPVYPHMNVRPTQSTRCPLTTPLPQAASHCLAVHPLCPSCLFPPLLPVWMNVSSLTPWLSDFHTVWFSGSSGWFLNWLFSFFWCEELKSIYLHFHLGQKPLSFLVVFFLMSSFSVQANWLGRLTRSEVL